MNGGEIPQPRKHRSCSVIPSSREQLMSSTASLYTTPCAARFQPTCTYSPAHHGAGTGIWGLAFTYKFILHTPGERKIFEWHSQIPPFLKSFFKDNGLWGKHSVFSERRDHTFDNFPFETLSSWHT